MSRERIGQKKYRPGFTLIELLVVLVIMSLVLVVMVPKLGAIYDRQLVEQQVDILEKELMWLRTEAQRTGNPAIFKCLEGHGYALTVEGPMGKQSDTREVVNKRVRLDMNTTGRQIVFYAKGSVFEKGTLTVRCGDEVRSIVVNNFGRIRVGKHHE